MQRTVMILAAIFGAALAPVSALADGQESGWWWSPTFRFTSVVDDNVYSTKGNTSGDVAFWIAPRVELGYRGSALEVGADLGVDVRQYIDERSASDELWRAVGFAELGLAEGLSLRVSNAYVPQTVVLGLPEDDTLNSVQTNRAEVALDWARDLSSGRSLSVGLLGTHFYTESYSEAFPAAGGGFMIDPNFRGSYLQGLVFAQLDEEFAKRTRVWARTQVSYRDFTKFSSADHTNLSLLIGVESERWSGVELEAAVGGGGVFFNGLGTGYRVVARARALRRFENGLSIWLSGSYLHSPDLTGDEVDESSGEIGFEQRFGSATALSLRGFITYYDASLVGGGANLFGGGEISLRRQFTRRFQIGLVYRYWGNGGNFSADDFSQNRVGLELGFRL